MHLMACSILNSSNHSSSSGGFSTWGMTPQCAASARMVPQENYYNNPLPCVGPGQNRFQVTPTAQHPPPLPPYFAGSGQLPPRNIHIHYPSAASRHAMSEYQPSNTHNSRCSNTRTCNSCDALASPVQPLPPPGEGWYQPLQGANGSNSHQPIYQCSSECSDHSRHSHMHIVPPHSAHAYPHSHQHFHNNHAAHGPNDTMCSGSSQENGVKITNNYRGHKSRNNHAANEIDGDLMLKTGTVSSTSCTYEVLDGEAHHQRQRNCSECCSSREGDTCSCSDGSCLYAEAGEPTAPAPAVSVAVVPAVKTSSASN